LNKNKILIPKLTSINAILIYLSLFKLILLLIFGSNYGIFRDEYYYIATSKHLAFGYVDVQPLSAILLAISRFIFGDSIFGIRIFAYLAGSIIVLVTGLIARELGGSKLAQISSAFLVIFCGVVLGATSYFSMNSFDILLSTLMFYYLIKLINTDNPKLWIIIGLLFGIGLENKLSFLFLGIGLAAGLILTKHRRQLKLKELWTGVALAVLILLPNIIWQITNHYPTLDFMHNAAIYKNRPMSLLEFFGASLFELNPGYTLFIFTGLYLLFFDSEGKKYNILGWTYVVVFFVFAFNNGKPYYMGVLYPMILAAGVIGADVLITKYLKSWVKVVLAGIVIPFCFVIVPFAIPLLNIDSFIQYSKALGVQQKNEERSELGLLPQFYSDRFGWEEMVKQVADAYNQLTEEEKKHTLIFGQNYGEAGAVNFYREKYELPQAISAHNNYWIWGYPKDFKTEVIIVIGSNLKDNSEFFDDVTLFTHHYNKYGMPFENVDIFICKHPKKPLKDVWDELKFYI
jgi:hypothetical protein